MKMAKDLSFIRLRAFNPRTSPRETDLPLSLGGVLGKEKEYRPRAKETIAPIINGFEVIDIETHDGSG